MKMSSKTTPTSGTKPRIVFFGSGPVAAASLELLLESFTIETVVTKPKPAHHKGVFPVIEVAERIHAPIIYVSSKKEVSEKITASVFESSVAVLIDFGIIVAEDVIDAFPLGIINSHFSLLPELRGADPITFALLSGQERTGVSLMHLVVAMDEGPLLATGIQNNISTLNNTELTYHLVQLSYVLLRDMLPGYIDGTITSYIDQQNVHTAITTFPYPATPSYTRKLTKADGLLDFNKPALQLEREVRAFNEWPKSRTVIAGKDVVITAVHIAENTLENVDKKTVFVANKQLCMQTADGILIIDRLKPAGKPDMSAAAFLAGHAASL